MRKVVGTVRSFLISALAISMLMGIVMTLVTGSPMGLEIDWILIIVIGAVALMHMKEEK